CTLWGIAVWSGGHRVPAAQPSLHAPHGHEPQGLGDDAPGELGVTVLPLAEADRAFGDRESVAPCAERELDLEAVALGVRRILEDVGNESLAVHAEAAGGVVDRETQEEPRVGVPRL